MPPYEVVISIVISILYITASYIHTFFVAGDDMNKRSVQLLKHIKAQGVALTSDE